MTKDLIDTRLRILSWNIWWRYGPFERRQPAIIDTLKNIDADVIALQEVWGDGDSNLAQVIAEELGYHHVFRSNGNTEKFEFGNAILSRWAIETSDFTMLFGHEGSDEKRLALFAKVNGPRGDIPVFATHLNWKFEHSHIRQRQVADLARFIRNHEFSDFPSVVLGDFNAEPQSEEIRMLKGLTTVPVEGMVFHDAWEVAGDVGSQGFTWDNTNPYVKAEYEPDRRIDYILVAPPKKESGAGQIVECRVVGNHPVDDVWASDHHALLAEVRY
ncbi:MAG: endonuclease [Hyphomicrobiales bacterium]|nr:MAG: endonuclease [Hyphomicrobiales bacterium]